MEKTLFCRKHKIFELVRPYMHVCDSRVVSEPSGGEGNNENLVSFLACMVSSDDERTLTHTRLMTTPQAAVIIIIVASIS